MDIKRAVLEIIFRKIHFETISVYSLSGENSYKSVQKNCFMQAARGSLSYNTEDENEQLYLWAMEQLKTEEGIFTFILKAAEEFLTIEDSSIFYKDKRWDIESQFFHWKELVSSLGQELFIAALLANADDKQGVPTADCFCVPFPEIDFADLKNLVGKNGGRGLAENHFHLKGSFPVFLLNWTCLMNHIGEGNDFFHRFGEYREMESVAQESDRDRKNLFFSAICAASYRLHLYEVYSGVPEEAQLPFRYDRDFDESDLSRLQCRIACYQESMYGKWEFDQGKWVYPLDYALNELWDTCYNQNEVSIAGERYFLYRCFRAILKKEPCFKEAEKNLFYKYLLISFRIRSELVQTNKMRGFENFMIYQDRKEDIIDYYPQYQQEVIRLTACSLRKRQNMDSLEMRLTPKPSAEETLNRIKMYDEEIERSSFDKEKIADDYFYVLHFPKEREDNDKEEILDARNCFLREKMTRHLEEQKQLIRLEKSEYDYMGKRPRIRGYDTCSGEIGCRPEVFAPFYRSIQSFIKEENIDWIHFTYHVGEDFLDLLDGLRAIDEAVQFCELPARSRLGHGMALGIDADKYYRIKNKKIILPKQDLMDNIAWTLGFCQENGIVIEESLKEKLQGQFHELLVSVYGIGQKTIAIKADASILKEQDLAMEEAAASMECGTIPKDWEAYYEAWKLRGDCPKLYKRYDLPVESTLPEGELRSGLNQIREKSLCCYYYKSYHFDSKVREEGRKPHVFSVSRSYIKLITKIQEELRDILTEKQIGIECNPTSNYKIGPFYRYEEHPMFRMYGKNLNDYPSARMNISINTDDMGIFQTSLEMEYAALYMALKKSRDEKGNARYKKEQIRKWLEDVKQFGHSQAFRMNEQNSKY